jgi:DNA processing protein
LTEDALRECAAFLGLKEFQHLGDRGIRKLVDEYGSASAALAEMEGQRRARIPGPGPRELRAWVEEGMQVVPMTGSGYPASLLELSDPPPLLFLKGSPGLLDTPSVAVVGSRRATEVGRRAAETVGRLLSEVGITVVSGMALGIDGAAHRGALLGGGRTVAVLGSGLHVVYPGSHRPLFREIQASGLAVSEFLPGERALPYHFPRRNRIIAALSRAVVVVEAGSRSGALITVDHALDLGREVLAMPGSVESSQSNGTNNLLRDGARVLSHPEGILEALAGLVAEVESPGQESSPTNAGARSLPSGLKPLWAALSQEPLSVDQVALRAAVPFQQALAGLAALELEGWINQCPGMRFRRR